MAIGTARDNHLPSPAGSVVYGDGTNEIVRTDKALFTSLIIEPFSISNEGATFVLFISFQFIVNAPPQPALCL